MKKITAIMLALLMVVSIIPMSALAESVYFDYESKTHTVFQSIKSTLAPGVTSSTNYAYATSDGEQMVYYVATADIARDDVELHSTFKDASIEATGMETLTNQMKAANNKYKKTNPYFQSVAGINADAFNMTTGKPQGAFYMDGKTLEEGCKNFPWFAVFEDGTAWCGAGNTDWDAAIEAHGKPMEAVGGFQLIMRDGETVAHADSAYCGSKRYPRSLVGVTAEGKVVIVGIDGNQKPFSVGANYDECFQIMKEQGCVQALCLDGGGSATFVTRPEGENDIKLTNRPSDGSERSVSSGLVLATTTPPSNVFERATLTAEDLYLTPGTTTNISAMGISPAGSAAVIPDDVTYEATNGTFENGVFTAGELAEDAVVSMCYNGKVVGSVTIHVVVPEKIEFQTETMTVPYSAKVGVNLTAFYGLNEVKIKSSDINFVLENSEIGELNGFDFIATDGNATVAQSKLTANVVADASVSAETLIKLGKGSEVVYSFEDEAQMDAIYGEGMPNYNYVYPETKQWLANKETGKVHSGNHSFGVNFNYSNSLESGYMGTHLVAKEAMVFENATRIGMWIYIPDEAVGLWPRWIISPITIGENGGITYGDIFNGNDLDGVSKGASTGFVSKFNESGWHYLSIDTSKYPAVGWKAGSTIMQFYISDRDGSDHGYDHSDYPNQNGNYTFYIDDITVDYSEAVDDREAPIFSDLKYANADMSDASSLNGQTSTNNVLNLSATVAENTNKSNYSGLDVSTAKAYVDGVEVGCSINNGLISAEKQTLANGTHTVKFSICDKMGNYSSIIRQININAANSASTIMVRPHDATLNRILFGSLYYVDVVATDIEKVQSVTTVLDLNNISVWNLKHMDVAKGFEAEYTISADENIATVTITRSGKNDSTGEGVLVSMPIRTWELKMGYVYENGVKKGMQAFTYKNFRDMKEFWWIDINVEIDKGVVTFVDGTTGTFSGKKVSVDTEMWAEDGDMIASTNTEGVAYYNTWNGGHIHTAEALENKAATCEEAGYTDRTFCKVCNSVVEWGTIVPATGHTYEVKDGVLKCKDCDKLFNGELDGKTYVDGIVLDGWVGDKYYKDGAMFTGVKAVDGVYYDFGKDGNSKGTFTGDFTGEDGKHYYAKLGSLVGGWFVIDGEWYYFDKTTFAGVSGEYVYSKFSYITYNFDEDGKLTEGVWYHDGTGYRYYYGPDYYKNGFQTIDGKTYAFLDNVRLEGGIYRIKYSQSAEGWQLAKFDENGVYLGDVEGEGLVDCVNGLYYYVDGKPQSGLAKVDGKYYYFNNIDLKAVKNCKYKVSDRNGITDLPYGEYEFDSEGKLIHKNGIYLSGSNYYYYENSKKTNAGLVKVGDDYYYSKDNGLIAVNGIYTVTKTSCDLPAGEKYKFGADGKMLNGLVDEGKYTFYYENGKRVKAGIVEINGDYYYIDDNCLPKTNGTYTVKKSTVAEVPVGSKCKFDADGKMYNGVYEEGTAGNRYYYEFGRRVEAGVVEADGEYYYARTGGLCAKNGTFTVTKSSVEGVEVGDKCRVHEDARVYNGIEEVNGNLYYYNVGKRVVAGLVNVDGDYYFTKDGGLVAVNGTFTVDTTSCDLPAGEKYKFGADGKMLQGVVAEGTAGNSYYYVNGKRVAAGLVEFDGNIYYAKDSGLVAKNGSFTATKTSVEDLETGVTYKFDSEGKAYQGLVDEGQYTYYYENGRRANAGLVKVDGDYYCVNKSGIIIKGEEAAPTVSKCDLPAGVGIKYSFGADGNMLQGIVDGYYYKNGQKTYAGLVKIADDYYYIGKDFKPVCNATQFAFFTDCDLAGGVSYTFGADGKIVK